MNDNLTLTSDPFYGNVANIAPKLLGMGILCIILIYPPLTFVAFVNDTLRVGLFNVVFLSMLLYQFSGSIKKSAIIAIFFMWLFVFIFLAATLYINRGDASRTAIGYSLILAFAVAVFGLMQTERQTYFARMLFKIYIVFFFIAPVFSSLNFVINTLTSSLNFLTSYFTIYRDEYNASLFGLTIHKSVFGIPFVRSFFFFNEPVYMSFFCLVNVFIIGDRLPRHGKLFKILNLVGGLLTISFFFYFGYIAVQLGRRLSRVSLFGKIMMFVAGAAVLFFFPTQLMGLVTNSTSSEDRLMRIDYALTILKIFDFQRIMLGSGYLFDHGIDRGISSGLFSAIVEGGVIGLVIPLILALKFCRGNKSLIFIVFLGLLLLELFKYPLIWLTIIIAGNISRMPFTVHVNKSNLIRAENGE